jgi:hypothetical protein
LHPSAGNNVNQQRLALNDAFAAIGWYWGGRWSSPDYQHFSLTGG